MNTYLFIELTRKDGPTLHYTVLADTPEEAIEKAEYHPFTLPDDFQGMEEKDQDWMPEHSWQVNEVHKYYGLVDGTNWWDTANGDGTYGTMLIELDENVQTRVFGYQRS